MCAAGYPYPSGSGRGAPSIATTGYSILPNATAALPAGDLGFIVTANGQGGYRIAWSDTQGSSAYFHGSIFTGGQFLSSNPIPGAKLDYLTPTQGRVDFSSQPGSALDGVDVVSSTDPIYVDLMINGSTNGVAIYFTQSQTAQLSMSQIDPVAFTSP
jgi:hypothetical protein